MFRRGWKEGRRQKNKKKDFFECFFCLYITIYYYYYYFFKNIYLIINYCFSNVSLTKVFQCCFNVFQKLLCKLCLLFCFFWVAER